MSAEECEHPDEMVEWKKWPSSMGPPKFGRQCESCGECLDKPLVKLRNVPLEVDAGACLMAKISRSTMGKKSGRTGLGGRGNSKSRAYAAYMRSAAWRGPEGVREFVLRRDGRICQDCGEEANTAAHIKYPKDIRDTRPSDCKASCEECNQAERPQRIGGGS